MGTIAKFDYVYFFHLPREYLHNNAIRIICYINSSLIYTLQMFSHFIEN